MNRPTSIVRLAESRGPFSEIAISGRVPPGAVGPARPIFGIKEGRRVLENLLHADRFVPTGATVANVTAA